MKLCKPRRERRAWTARDDELLRKFHAEGKHDGVIAYIIDRGSGLVALHRKRLGLRAHPRSPSCGWKHSQEARAKVSEHVRRRWRDPQQRVLFMQNLAKTKANRRPFRPPRGTPEFKRYLKLCAVLGPLAARRALAAGHI